MIVPLIFGIWFGRRALRNHRNPVLWGLGGALLVFLLTSILANAMLVAASPLSSVGDYAAIRIAASVLGIALSIGVGHAWLAHRGLSAAPSAVLAETSGSEESANESSPGASVPTPSTDFSIVAPGHEQAPSLAPIRIRARSRQLLEICPHCQSQVLFLGLNCPHCGKASARPEPGE